MTAHAMDSRLDGDCDVVVVGFGVSAGPLIERLLAANPGVRMLVLDRGRVWDYSTCRADEFGRTIDPSVDHILLRSRLSPAAEVVRKRWAPDFAGGGWLLWYGQLSRFCASDFALAERSRGRAEFGDVRDWPVGLDELTPWYDEIERVLAPVGCAYGHAEDDYLRLDCTHLRLRRLPSHFERTVIDRLQLAGIPAHVGQTCLGGRAWDRSPVDPWQLSPQPETAPLTMRTTWYARCRELIANHPRARLDGDIYVTRLLVEDGAIRGVCAIGPGGAAEREIRAGTVVLGCGALETVRILLSSGLPNRNGLLGRRFTFTTERNAYLVTNLDRTSSPRDRAAGMFASVVVKDYEGPPVAYGPVKGGKLTIYDAPVAELPDRQISNAGLHGDELQAFLEAGNTRYVLKLSFKGESIPWIGKFVELSGHVNAYGAQVPLIHYDLHAEDHLVAEYALAMFERVAGAFPGSQLLIQPAREGAAAVSAHQHGGAVFGRDPDDAVLSPWCECFEARGLFVVDGSFMPTSGATNSSLTLMANAMRVATAVGHRLTAESA